MKLRQYNLPLARAKRNIGIAQVTQEAFRDKVYDYVISLKEGIEMTGEDIRRACENRGILAHHHNAWGGTILGLIRNGYLTKTGRWAQMKDTKSHARSTQVLKR